MSWVSKTINNTLGKRKGKLFKQGMLLLGAHTVGNYFRGDYLNIRDSGQVYPGGIENIPINYSSQSLTSKGLRQLDKFGLPRYKGSFLDTKITGYGKSVKSFFGIKEGSETDKFVTGSAKKLGKSAINQFFGREGIGGAPDSITTRVSPNLVPIKEKDFRASVANLMPIGNNGKALSALESPTTRNMLINKLTVAGLPVENVVQPMGLTTVTAQTKSSRRRKLKKLIG